MKKYFFDNQILSFASDIIDAIPEAIALTPDQIAFLEANKADYDKGLLSVDEVRDCKRIEVVSITPNYEDLRRNEYFTTQCVNWQDKMLTVEDANRLFMYYRAEGDETRALALQNLIKEQKEIIRVKYPKPE